MGLGDWVGGAGKRMTLDHTALLEDDEFLGGLRVMPTAKSNGLRIHSVTPVNGAESDLTCFVP